MGEHGGPAAMGQVITVVDMMVGKVDGEVEVEVMGGHVPPPDGPSDQYRRGIDGQGDEGISTNLKVKVDQLSYQLLYPIDRTSASAITSAYGIGDDLGRPTQTHLSLLRSPLPISVPIVDNLITSRIPKLRSRMRQSTIGRPLDLVASRFGH